ncbi:hypothetical protein O181_050501 [Austropuccinia psidii MF-1]|uniref:Uncharacterized protein n=1 Tax=Austropuccinia psidii MF-1 TaxID=1389203 RepID=A0A9Q3E1X6_9BASI|nr:hypothetical protein [Austropuccinia psidii MF-1]
MSSAISGARYNPLTSSQKRYICDYGTHQSVTEGQGSVNESQNEKLCHSTADYTVFPSDRAENNTRIFSGPLKSQLEVIQQCTSIQCVSTPRRPLKNCMKPFLTVKKLLGHPNTSKLLN